MSVFMRFTEKKELFARFDGTIHRILANPVMTEGICNCQEMAEVTEAKTELAIYSQVFTAAIPEMAKAIAQAFGIDK